MNVIYYVNEVWLSNTVSLRFSFSITNGFRVVFDWNEWNFLTTKFSLIYKVFFEASRNIKYLVEVG